jgi:hypothetical protein
MKLRPVLVLVRPGGSATEGLSDRSAVKIEPA